MNQSPRVLGNRYEVGDLLGRGGMAEVHLGRDTRLGRVVAIKLLRTDLARDPIFQARFRREAQSAAGLNHPAIVAVYDTGEETIAESGGSTVSLPYIVMEYVEGRTLRDVLREGEPMEVQHALEVTGGVLSALDYSHRMGIVHRDIKPANVMLTAGGDVKVMDFGIARALADVSATMTQTQAVIGTAQYLSPEQARGETVDARSDLYSAGCLLFELMTGRPPFVADSPVAVAYQHVREAPPPPSAFNPRIPEVVDRIVLHALAKDREARYQTANDFRADLESAVAGRSVAAPTAAMASPALGSPGQGATEYLPQPAGSTQAYSATYPQAGLPPAGQAQGYPPQGATQAYPQGPGGFGGQYDHGYDPQYGQQYPPPGAADGGYSRRGERRAESAGTNRRVGFIVLALLVIVVFAGAAYGVSYLVSKNSAANAQVLVPSVRANESVADAQKVIKASGFKVVLVSEPSDVVKAGLATRINPTGTQPRGSQVTLYVSNGTASVTVPPVKGMSVAAATRILQQAGLTVADIRNPVDGGGLAQNVVVGTEPAAGQSVARGRQVTLDISNGKVTIPNEVGQDIDAAEKDLLSKGFSSGTIQVNDVPSDQTAGTVLAQDPQPGTTTTAPKQITLTVAIAPTDQTQPSTSGDGQGNGGTGTWNGGGNTGTGGGNGNG